MNAGALQTAGGQGQPRYGRRRLPAYGRELRSARIAGACINLHAHVGKSAWNRAQGREPGNRLVVVLDDLTGPLDYDFTITAGLDITLNAVDCDIVFARQIAVRMCEDGARMVVLLHPILPGGAHFFYGGSR